MAEVGEKDWVMTPARGIDCKRGAELSGISVCANGVTEGQDRNE